MNEKYVRQIKNILAIMLTVLLLAVFKITASFSINLVLSIFIFFFVVPVANVLEKHKVPSVIASILSILIIVVVIVVVCRFIVNAANILVTTLPGYATRINEIDNLLVSIVNKRFALPENYSIISALDIDWVSIIMAAVKKVSSQTASIATNALVTLLFTVFLMLERHTLIPKIIMISSKNSDPERIVKIMDNINHHVSKYLFLKLVISFVTGLCFYFIAVFTHLDFALIWGVLAFVLNFIPSFGSIIITLLTILMAVVQFAPNWTPVIVVSLSTIIVQNLLGNIIEPRIQGTQLNLSSFVILVAASLFGYIWGIVGMFLAVPLLSVIEIIFANVEATKGVAIILSSGRSLRKRIKFERKNKSSNSMDDYYI